MKMILSSAQCLGPSISSRNGSEKMYFSHEMFNEYELHVLRFLFSLYVRLSSCPKFKRVHSPSKEDLLNPECTVSEKMPV